MLRKVTGKSDAKTEEILAAHEVTFAQDGNKVEVRASTKLGDVTIRRAPRLGEEA